MRFSDDKHSFVEWQAIADVIRTCLGPQAMLKMLMDPMGGIVMTNDGNAILREITVQHPAAKTMIEIARTQDEEVGDGTTSVIVLAGEILTVAEPFLTQQVHPTVIIRQFREALEHIVELLDGKAWDDASYSIAVDRNDKETLQKVVSICCERLFESHKLIIDFAFALGQILCRNQVHWSLVGIGSENCPGGSRNGGFDRKWPH